MKSIIEENKKCDGCGKIKDDVKKRTVKENGIVGYYDVEKNYCEKCRNAHNQDLLANWE